MFLDHKILCFILHFLSFQINNLGAVGLTENLVQLLRWMVCDPEIAPCVNEFESNLPIYQKDNQKDHINTMNKKRATKADFLFICQILFK